MELPAEGVDDFIELGYDEVKIDQIFGTYDRLKNAAKRMVPTVKAGAIESGVSPMVNPSIAFKSET